MHKEGKSVVAEKFIRTLKKKIYKYMSSVSQNVHIDDIVNKYSNTYHRTINMKLVDVKPNTDINSSQEINDEDPKFKMGNIVRISKYKNIFAKGYVPNWSEEVFVNKMSKTLFRRHVLIVILKAKKLLERFTKKDCKKQIEKRLVLKK